MKKILITGDSFAADWTKKYDGVGWVNMLNNDFEVTNIAQAGVSEYKIHKQLLSQNISDYDYVLVSHTSPYRIPIIEHPIHSNDILHKDCDLIYSDIKEHLENPIAKMAVDFYENIFNPEYFIYVHNLIIKEIQTKYPTALNITFFNSFKNKNIHGFEHVFLKNKGVINHMNNRGNEIIYNKVKKLINE